MELEFLTVRESIALATAGETILESAEFAPPSSKEEEEAKSNLKSAVNKLKTLLAKTLTSDSSTIPPGMMN
jgi:hypothetical protein